MKAITILQWTMFYLLNAGMIFRVVPTGFGIPLMLISFFFAVWGSLSVKSAETMLSVAQVYATGVKPQDFEVKSGETKTPTA